MTTGDDGPPEEDEGPPAGLDGDAEPGGGGAEEDDGGEDALPLVGAGVAVPTLLVLSGMLRMSDSVGRPVPSRMVMTPVSPSRPVPSGMVMTPVSPDPGLLTRLLRGVGRPAGAVKLGVYWPAGRVKDEGWA